MAKMRSDLFRSLVAVVVCCATANAVADAVVTNFWVGGNSEGGGWATAENWSAGVPTSEQIVAFRNGDSVEISADDLATALSVAGIDIDGAGTTLYLQQAATAANTYPSVNVGENSVLYIQRDKNTTLKSLNGSGLVTNASTAARSLFLGETGSKIVSAFSGRICGRMSIWANGFVRLSGRESTATETFIVYRNKSADNGAPLYGVAEIAKFGMSGDASSSVGKPWTDFSNPSIALRYSGWLTYIGDGETTDRYIQFRFQSQGKHDYPDTLDAGAHGDVRFVGKFGTSHEGERASTIALTGSNAVPCVVAGPWIDNGVGTGFVYKRGSGTWRFADNAERRNRNGFAVEEGTLQFDSIAETNVVCSLGLATKLQKPYIGTYTEANNVDYAYLLGGSTTNVVFEYTGSNYCFVSTRPIALTGKGARLKSSSPESSGGISFSGVSAQSGGEEVKTLWLAGTNTTSYVGEISDGDGKVGVTKEGPGTWTLIGNHTFSGPLTVEEGVLNVARKRKYTWFRFTVKGVTGQMFYLNELGLFNDVGELQTIGIVAVNPSGMPASSVSYKYINGDVDYKNLKAGEVAIASSKSLAYFSSSSTWVSGLFDGNTTKYWRSAYTGTLPTWNDETTHIPIVLRLPESADEVSSCDVASQHTSQSVTAFSLDGSVDGVVWKNLVNKKEGSFDYTTKNKWLSDMSAFPTVGDTHIPEESWRFVGHEGGDNCSVLENVSGVNVAPGATLRAVDEVALHILTLDAANGNGTIDGFDFAETGVIDVVNMPSGTGSAVVSITLANLPEGALARLNGWSVRINGSASAATVSFNGSTATVTRPGCMIIVK
ncbi:MAG: autotransporter-associated beta strand repeat-containing protein [Kiritimatiellae bacterium]|nr:autotransporter-associated beta strand repeat-containing protein [Kiritimatiellia bacterium]